jgi:hypothetical protein
MASPLVSDEVRLSHCSFGFDIEATYNEVTDQMKIADTMSDGVNWLQYFHSLFRGDCSLPSSKAKSDITDTLDAFKRRYKRFMSHFLCRVRLL